ncbi:MAG: ATP-binding protein [Candidatus Omnitrophota bacterium]
MRDLTATEARINSKIGKAINDYNLIEDGDNILIAVSGGKDSFALLYMLKKIQTWAPVKFSIHAAHITTDLECSGHFRRKELEQVLQDMGVRCFFSHADVLDEERKTSCFWCSWTKRKALFGIAKENFFNKLAFGHHKDDIAQTVLLNLFFKGEISAINPRQELFGEKLTLIRPLCYVEEELTAAYAKEKGFYSGSCSCQFGELSKRKLVKEIISEIEEKTQGINIKTNIFNAISRIKEEYIDLKMEKTGKLK